MCKVLIEKNTLNELCNYDENTDDNNFNNIIGLNIDYRDMIKLKIEKESKIVKLLL